MGIAKFVVPDPNEFVRRSYINLEYHFNGGIRLREESIYQSRPAFNWFTSSDIKIAPFNDSDGYWIQGIGQTQGNFKLIK